MTQTQQAREAALQGPIADLEAVLLSWRNDTDYALRYLDGLEAYPLAQRSLTALKGVRAALEPIGPLDEPAKMAV